VLGVFGWVGCVWVGVVCLCRDAEVPLIKAAVEKHYFERFNLNADIYVCSAGSGLQITSF